MQTPPQLKNFIAGLKPAQRQWAMLGTVLAVAIGLLWTIFSVTQKEAPKNPQQAVNTQPSKVTNIGVMPAGAQVTAVDQWVGNAGRKLAQYERDKQEQEKLNKDQVDFQNRTMQRFNELEDKLRTQPAQVMQPPAHPPVPPLPATQPAVSSTLPPPPPPPKSSIQPNGMPPGVPSGISFGQEQTAPTLVRLSLVDPAKVSQTQNTEPLSGNSTKQDNAKRVETVDSYLPVSFTRGILLGGLDAPTGGQSQSDPPPVIIRLEDNAILPNKFRSNVKECFVIAGGYGDISSERAYLRTESLSCVSNDGSILEVKIKGSVYGEDGKVGIRGRLVTKQGQILANALASGIVSGIGQGFSQRDSSVSTSALGTIATTEGNRVFERGIGAGVGRAMDRLAQYYIKLAEQTFPVIEIDAGRQVDVVITKGTQLSAGFVESAESGDAASKAVNSRQTSNNELSLKAANDEDY